MAVLAGVLVGPQLPGADDEAAIDWENRSNEGAGNRTTVSPIVDLRRRLVNQTDQEFFRVRADRPAYWRLTALDRFDGQLWTIDREFSSAGEDLTSRFGGRGRPLTQRFSMTSLDDLWVPAAYEAREVGFSSESLRWDPDTSTLIIDRDSGGTAGMVYQVISIESS